MKPAHKNLHSVHWCEQIFFCTTKTLVPCTARWVAWYKQVTWMCLTSLGALTWARCFFSSFSYSYSFQIILFVQFLLKCIKLKFCLFENVLWAFLVFDMLLVIFSPQKLFLPLLPLSLWSLSHQSLLRPLSSHPPYHRFLFFFCCFW